jgi:hypothetical protein
MRKTIVIADGFYAEPQSVVAYARSLRFYHPYQRDTLVRSGAVRPSWMTSWFRPRAECPFKSSSRLVAALEHLTGERVDMDHWGLGFPTDAEGKAAPGCRMEPRSCLWNCSFHVKLHNRQELGEGVHNHVTDSWNSVERDGWTGIVYLDPDAPLEGGLKLWRNRNPTRQFDWMTAKANWELIDDLGNVFNRLLLIRGDIPHSGADGWGHGLDDGRLFQTFFFKVREPGRPRSVSVKACASMGSTP